MESKKIYPDFNRENKWLGIIDYKSLIILFIYTISLWYIIGLFLEDTFTKMYILVIMTLPVFCIFYTNISETNTTYVVYIILKYIFSKKLYVYKINQSINGNIFNRVSLFKKIQI